jgi:hypothetical protein
MNETTTLQSPDRPAGGPLSLPCCVVGVAGTQGKGDGGEYLAASRGD